MSYDYMLVKGSPGSGLEALVEGAMSQTIGTVENVRAWIGGLFPSVRWQQGPGEGWFAQADEAEFTFLVEPEGQVRMLWMSRCERAAVERVAKELGLVALDEQSMEQFGA
jgi:hypothetical protein